MNLKNPKVILAALAVSVCIVGAYLFLQDDKKFQKEREVVLSQILKNLSSVMTDHKPFGKEVKFGYRNDGSLHITFPPSQHATFTVPNIIRDISDKLLVSEIGENQWKIVLRSKSDLSDLKDDYEEYLAHYNAAQKQVKNILSVRLIDIREDKSILEKHIESIGKVAEINGLFSQKYIVKVFNKHLQDIDGHKKSQDYWRITPLEEERIKFALKEAWPNGFKQPIDVAQSQDPNSNHYLSISPAILKVCSSLRRLKRAKDQINVLGVKNEGTAWSILYNLSRIKNIKNGDQFMVKLKVGNDEPQTLYDAAIVMNNIKQNISVQVPQNTNKFYKFTATVIRSGNEINNLNALLHSECFNLQ